MLNFFYSKPRGGTHEKRPDSENCLVVNSTVFSCSGNCCVPLRRETMKTVLVLLLCSYLTAESFNYQWVAVTTAVEAEAELLKHPESPRFLERLKNLLKPGSQKEVAASASLEKAKSQGLKLEQNSHSLTPLKTEVSGKLATVTAKLSFFRKWSNGHTEKSDRTVNFEVECIPLSDRVCRWVVANEKVVE